MSGPTSDLIHRAAAGDRAAFDELTRLHQGELQAAVHSRLGPALRARVEVADVVQETLLKAFESIAGFRERGEGSFLRWLRAIADNLLLYWARREGRYEALPASDIAGSAGSLSAGLRREERFQRLERAVLALGIGTVAYMSPEQAMAQRVPVDRRTDIYSLGATLHELLARRPPFAGKDYRQTLSRIIAEDPEPLTRINPRISRDLETVVLKCLRKSPDDRYGTAEALAQDLRRVARGDAIEARPQTAWERWSRRAWRHRARLLVAAVVAGLLAGGAARGLRDRRCHDAGRHRPRDDHL